jgi:hypothetical protein
MSKLLADAATPQPLYEMVTCYEESQQTDEFPRPDLNDEYAIHTYARPRAFTALRRSRSVMSGESQQKVIEIPMPRNGVSGWKLMKPKRRLGKRMGLKKKEERKSGKVKKRQSNVEDELKEYYYEPYLRFLAEKNRKAEG